MTKITVKRWIADKTRNEIQGYHLDGCFEYFDGFYADKENDTVTFLLDADILQETEKAVQVALKCETVGGRYHEAYKAWFPKSQIVAFA